MTVKTLATLCATISLLAACETYTEKTSPCFGRNGKPQVSQTALSFNTLNFAAENAPKDCVFDTLPRPE
jgi:hypothetical protein